MTYQRIAHGDHFRDGSATDATVVVNSHSDGLERLEAMVFNVKDYGALGNGSHDDTAAIQAAVDAATVSGGAGQYGGAVVFPAGVYNVTGLVPKNGVIWQGAGQRSTRIRNTAGPVVTVTAAVYDWSVRDLTLYAVGDHVVKQTAGPVAKAKFHRVFFQQDTANKSLWDAPLADVIGCTFADCEAQHTTDSSVPGWNLVSSDGGTNCNTWQNYWHTYSGTAPVFWVESRASGAYTYDNHWEDCVLEIINGGFLNLLSGQGNRIKNCVAYDGGTTTQHMINIGKSTFAGAPISTTNIIEASGRRGGTLGGGLYDINLVTGEVSGTSIIAGGSSAGNTLQANSTDAMVIGSYKGTILNGESTVQITGPLLKASANTTGNLYDPSTIPAGTVQFDTTLKMPKWSDGTAWRDGRGDVVTAARFRSTVKTYSFGSGAQTVDASLGSVFEVSLTATTGAWTVSNPTTGQIMYLTVKQTGAGSFTVGTWPTNFRWAANTAPTLTTTTGHQDNFTFRYDGTNWVEHARVLNTTTA